MASKSPHSVSSTASPKTDNSNNGSTDNMSQEEINLMRKRARDRKSQRAMRERTKYTIQYLSEQVASLTDQLARLNHALEQEVQEKEALKAENKALLERVVNMEGDAEATRMREAALQLRSLGEGPLETKCLEGDGRDLKGKEMLLATPAPSIPLSPQLEPYQRLPLNVPPGNLTDQIFQSFAESEWMRRRLNERNKAQGFDYYPDKPDLSPLLSDPPYRIAVDPVSTLLADIVRSYSVLDTLPKQMSVHFLMASLLKWLILRTRESFEQMPLWLRPTPEQLTIPHPSWIDRMPWPKLRNYLIRNNVVFEDFIFALSAVFDINWQYEPNLVVVTGTNADRQHEVLLNPTFEAHVRELKNWRVGEGLAAKYPGPASMAVE